MDPVEKAIWFVESRFASDISLEEVASVAGVSRYHLARAFGEATGWPVMGYVRARRLTEAARLLAAGAPDILAVALDAGYGSHEAFTRAFRDQFGVTPEQVRSERSLRKVRLVEAIRMDKSLIVELAEPRFESGRALLIAGLGARYTFEANQGIPLQWQRFGPHIGNIAGQVGTDAYGLCCNFDEDGSFEYIAGVEVSRFSDLPARFSTAQAPAQKYLVFSHRGHVSKLRAVSYTIWDKWLPESGYEPVNAPNFEMYGSEFDPETGSGLVEIWLPVRG